MRKQKAPSKIAAGPVRRVTTPPLVKESGQRNQSGGKHVSLGPTYFGKSLDYRKQNNADPTTKIGGQ